MAPLELSQVLAFKPTLRVERMEDDCTTFCARRAAGSPS
jgi:hypothetical protein